MMSIKTVRGRTRARSQSERLNPVFFVRRKDYVVWKVVDSKGILLNLDNGSYFEVGSTALAIWQKCDGRTSIAQVAKSIAKKFRVLPRKAHKDTLTFILNLKRQKLIEVSATPASFVSRIN